MPKPSLPLAWMFIAALGCIPLPTAWSNDESKPICLTIDPAAARQTIEHFGASDCWSMQKIGAWSEENKNKAADLLFSTDTGIGLTCWRFNLGAGRDPDHIGNSWRTVETFETGPGAYDWSRQAGERWFLRAAKARGVPYFLMFVNSPPRRMTRNGFSVCTEEIGTTNLKAGYETEFARYLADVLAHFHENPDEAERIAFQYVSPVNEPHVAWNDPGQEGNRASNDDIKSIVSALYRAIQERGLPTEIRVPESNTLNALLTKDFMLSRHYKAPYGDYIDWACKDPELNTKIGQTLCAHGYGSEKTRYLLPIRKRVRLKMDKHPDWRLWMSEYCVLQGPKGESGGGRDLSMQTALWVARLMHYDLTLLGASAWHWWTAVSNVDFKDGLIYTDYQKPGDPESIIPSKLLWVFGQFSRFIRPGMVRIEVAGADDPKGLIASAYLQPQDQRMVLVLINMADTDTIVLPQFAPAADPKRPMRFQPYITSDAPGDDLRACPEGSTGETFTVPAKAVVTLVGRP